MVATVNPCGFAMLPAYLGFFLGAEGSERDSRATVRRSLAVGLSVSAGFLAVFSAVGLAIYHLSASVDRWTPWATIVIGAVLVRARHRGAAGVRADARPAEAREGRRRRTGSSMFVFGVSYAVASISCSLPLFTSAVAGTFRRANLVSSLAVFVAYAVGMTLVLLALTVSLGMARQGLVRWLRKALPHVTRGVGRAAGRSPGPTSCTTAGTSGACGAAATRRAPGAVDVVTGWSDDIGRWVSDVGATRLGLLLALGLAGRPHRHLRPPGPRPLAALRGSLRRAPRATTGWRRTSSCARRSASSRSTAATSRRAPTGSQPRPRRRPAPRCTRCASPTGCGGTSPRSRCGPTSRPPSLPSSTTSTWRWRSTATGATGGGRRCCWGAATERWPATWRTTCGPRCPGYEVVDDLDAIPPELRGVHPANPVNRCAGGGRAARAAAPRAQLDAALGRPARRVRRSPTPPTWSAAWPPPRRLDASA